MANRNSRSRPNVWLGVLVPLTLFFSAGPSFGNELVTDRPDQTESAETVAPGLVQIELGAAITRERHRPRIETREFPQALIRIGLSPRLELRLGWGGDVETRADTPSGRLESGGGSDGELGAKLRLASGPAGDAALLCAVSVPVGDREVTSDRFDPSCRVSLATDLAAGWSLGVNLGIEWESEETVMGVSTTSRLLYTVAAGRGITERWAFFAELFGDAGGSAGGAPLHHFDGGLTWLVRPHVQLDAFAGAGLSGDAPDWLAGVGLSFRLPR